jgi:hypothetical protein
MIHRGRWTATLEGEVVVFLIGMRVNRLWAVHEWLPVALAMGPMLRELMRDPDSGLLGFRSFLEPRGVMMLQYWRSVEHLQAFAGEPARTHRPAWLRFYQRSWKNGSVGIWHETYRCDSFETVYANMPPIGLGRAGELQPVGARTETAAQRIGLKEAA